VVLDLSIEKRKTGEGARPLGPGERKRELDRAADAGLRILEELARKQLSPGISLRNIDAEVFVYRTKEGGEFSAKIPRKFLGTDFRITFDREDKALIVLDPKGTAIVRLGTEERGSPEGA
jgi:hypothetical protein